MKLTLSVVDGDFNDKQTCKPQNTFLSALVEFDLSDETGLRDFFRSKIHSPWMYEGTRSVANTTALLSVAFDFDGGEMSFEEACERFTGFAGVVYTSSSHTIEKPKIRVILVLPTPIIDIKALQPLCNWLKAEYPDADREVFKVSQPLFPCCEYDGGKTTTGFPLFQLSVLEGKPFIFPPEAFETSTKKKDTGAWGEPQTAGDFTLKNKAELEAVLTYYENKPIKKGTRNKELVRLCAKFRQCGCSETETFEMMCEFNVKEHVKPPYPRNGSESLEAIISHVYKDDVKPPAPENWAALRLALKQKSKETDQTDQEETDDSLEALIHAAKEAKIRAVSPAQCFVRRPGEDTGSIYYIVGNNKTQFMVGQNRTYFHIKQAKANGIIFDENITSLPAMNFQDVGIYLTGDRYVSMGQIFKDVRGYLTDYLVLRNPLNYSYLALWIIGTYSYTAWDAYPYISLRGQAQAGKTTVLERIASIAFNAREPSGMTPAMLRHVTHTDSGTVCVDEADRLGGGKKHEDGSIDSLEILNLGYKRGLPSGKMKRIKGGNFDGARYNVYSPKAIAGIENLHTALRSRCHEIMMQPITQEERIRLKIKKYQGGLPSIVMREDRIRNDLYICTLQCMEEPPSMVPASANIVGRHFELWNPIMFYADLVDQSNGDEKVTEEMVTLADLSLQNTLDDMSRSDYTIRVLVALRDMFADSAIPAVPGIASDDTLVYTVDTTYKYFCERTEFASWFSPDGNKKQWLTQRILDLKFKTGQQRIILPEWGDSRNVRLYFFDKELFADTVIHRLGQNTKPSDLIDNTGENNDTEESE